MNARRESIKKQILAALSHPEAEEGLYFRNLTVLHEEDDRDPVEGTQVEILDALKELLAEQQIRMDDSGKEVIFFLDR